MNDMIQEPNTTFPHSKTTESRRVSNATYLLLVVVVALSNKNIFSTKKLFYTKEKSSCSILLLL